MKKSDGFEQNRERLVKDFKALVSDAESLLQGASSASRETYESARGQLQGTINGARESLSDLNDGVRTRVSSAARASEEYVGDHPVQVLIMVGVAGFLLGMLFGRSQSSESEFDYRGPAGY